MTEGLSTEKFIDVLQDLHRKMDEGFGNIYEAVHALEDAAVRRRSECNGRMVSLETHLKI